MELTQAQKDALLAEVLGDVGKLHDLVGQLGAEFTSARAGMLATIQDAVNAIQPHAAKVFAIEAEKAAEQHKAVLRGLIEDAVTRPVAEATRELKEQTALAADASNRLQHQAGDTLARFWLPIAGLSAVFVLAIGLGGLVFFEFVHPQSFLSDADKSALVTGQKLQTAWPHLDAATHAKIDAAVTATSSD